MAVGTVDQRMAPMCAPLRATASFALAFAGGSLGLGWLRIYFLQRFDPRWSAEMHWALEVVTWPFLALMAAILFSIGASLSRGRIDPWRRSAYAGATLALLICAPSILGATSMSPLYSMFTWVLLLFGPLLAGSTVGWSATAAQQHSRAGITRSRH